MTIALRSLEMTVVLRSNDTCASFQWHLCFVSMALVLRSNDGSALYLMTIVLSSKGKGLLLVISSEALAESRNLFAKFFEQIP